MLSLGSGGCKKKKYVHVPYEVVPEDDTLPEPYYEGTVMTVGTMAHWRLKHAAGLLQDGSVLLAGGCGLENNVFNRFNDAEVFNPRTGKSYLVGNLTTRRTTVDGVTLNSGKVLVIGGATWMLSSNQDCDIYDPVTRTFTVCSQLMVMPRAMPQAIKLSDGKVLITGHYKQCEVYDPAVGPDGTFTATSGSMQEDKARHSLTLLADGRVLILGGQTNDGEIMATAEIYNPAGGSVTVVGNMNSTRQNHMAVRLGDGRVVITGGTDNTGAPLDSIEIFDPSDDSFTLQSVMLYGARSTAKGIRLSDGNILIAGSQPYFEVYMISDGSVQCVNAGVAARAEQRLTMLADNTVLISGGTWYDAPMEIFVPVGVTPDYGTDTDEAGDMREAIAAPVTVRMAGGQTLVLGGTTPEVYSPAFDAFQDSAGTMVTNRTGCAAVPLRGGGALIAGGDSGGALASAEIYDTVADAFTSTTGAMSTARANPVAVNLFDGTVLVMGEDSTADIYNSSSDDFTPTAGVMAESKTDYTASLLGNGKVLVAGGTTGAVVATVELYDPSTGLFTATDSLGTARSHHFQVTLRNGKVLLGGGVDASNAALVSTEVYDPVAGTWSAGPDLPCTMVAGAARLLGTGDVIIAGGRDAFSGTAPAASYIVYDPHTNAFTPLMPKTSHSGEAVIVLKDGRAMICGGVNSGGTPTTQAEVYHPADTYGTVRLADGVFSRRFNHTYRFTSGPLNNRILVCGGKVSDVGLLGVECEIYNPDNDSWRLTGDMMQPKRLCASWCRPDGKMMIFGGVGESSLLDTVEVFDPATETWEYGPDFMTKERG
ncbi:MAG: Kelch repeat-containing protein [Planctomycetota bacterium]